MFNVDALAARVEAKFSELRDAILGGDADVIRASGAQWFRSTSVPTTGVEIIQFDLFGSPNQIPLGYHGVVLFAGVQGIITGAAPTPGLPVFTFEPNAAVPGALTYGRAGVSGFSIVEASTPMESLAQSQLGMNQASRGIQLVTVHGSSALTPTGVAPFSFVGTVSTQQNTPLILPANYNLRYTLSMLPATPTPGPGAGSTATMSALIYIERNKP